MNVYYYECGKEPCIIEVENELSSLQKLVDGYIETLSFDIDNRSYVIIMNEEGRLMGLPVNGIVLPIDEKGAYGGNPSIPIVGNFFVCKYSGDDFVSITEHDIPNIQRIIKRQIFFMSN